MCVLVFAKQKAHKPKNRNFIFSTQFAWNLNFKNTIAYDWARRERWLFQDWSRGQWNIQHWWLMINVLPALPGEKVEFIIFQNKSKAQTYSMKHKSFSRKSQDKDWLEEQVFRDSIEMCVSWRHFICGSLILFQFMFALCWYHCPSMGNNNWERGRKAFGSIGSNRLSMLVIDSPTLSSLFIYSSCKIKVFKFESRQFEKPRGVRDESQPI